MSSGQGSTSHELAGARSAERIRKDRESLELEAELRERLEQMTVTLGTEDPLVVFVSAALERRSGAVLRAALAAVAARFEAEIEGLGELGDDVEVEGVYLSQREWSRDERRVVFSLGVGLHGHRIVDLAPLLGVPEAVEAIQLVGLLAELLKPFRAGLEDARLLFDVPEGMFHPRRGTVPLDPRVRFLGFRGLPRAANAVSTALCAIRTLRSGGGDPGVRFVPVSDLVDLAEQKRPEGYETLSGILSALRQYPRREWDLTEAFAMLEGGAVVGLGGWR